jgi:hypothetical protein
MLFERILRHLGLWQEGCASIPAPTRPGETTLDPWLDDRFFDYHTQPLAAFSAS